MDIHTYPFMSMLVNGENKFSEMVASVESLI